VTNLLTVVTEQQIYHKYSGFYCQATKQKVESEAQAPQGYYYTVQDVNTKLLWTFRVPTTRARLMCVN